MQLLSYIFLKRAQNPCLWVNCQTTKTTPTSPYQYLLPKIQEENGALPSCVKGVLPLWVRLTRKTHVRNWMVVQRDPLYTELSGHLISNESSLLALQAEGCAQFLRTTQARSHFILRDLGGTCYHFHCTGEKTEALRQYSIGMHRVRLRHSEGWTNSRTLWPNIDFGQKVYLTCLVFPLKNHFYFC